GQTYTVTFGKIGTAGHSDNNKCKGDWECRVEVEKQIAAKQKKGYLLVTDVPIVTDGKRDAKLEDAIASDPTNDDNFAVYADWLQEQGDVRGELAGIQLRL